MKKLFTTLAAAALAVAPLFAEGETGVIRLYGPYVSIPEGAEIVQDIVYGDLNDPSQPHMYIWENTFLVEAGLDDVVGEYNIFRCNQIWAGMGININPRVLKDGTVTNATPLALNLTNDEWRFHFMWKSDMACTITIGCGPEDKVMGGKKAEFAFNPGVGDYKFDGSWNMVDVPFTDILDQYASLDEETAYQRFFNKQLDINVITAVATDGCQNGGTYAIADAYFYGPKLSTSVDGIASDAEVVAEEYYSFDGVKMAAAPEKGLYLVKKTLSDGNVKAVKVVK